MKLEVTKQIEEAARHASPGKGWSVWLKEMVYLHSDLEDFNNKISHPNVMRTLVERSRGFQSQLILLAPSTQCNRNKIWL
jgi:hypothetical protein